MINVKSHDCGLIDLCIINSNAMKSNHPSQDSHYVLIADENGIPAAFQRLKMKLADHSANCMTLVYAVLKKESKPLFAAELQSLEKRFSNLLEVRLIEYEENAAIMKSKIKKAIEVILNSNINAAMQFYACGNSEWVEQVQKFLAFLGIGQSQIITEEL